MNKLFLRILALLLAVLCLTCSALADDDDRTITVTGTATVTVPADRASLNLGVRTSAAEASTASAENAEKVQKVTDALKAAGIPEECITTAYYYVNAMYDYSSFSDENVIRGYQVSNSLNVIVDEIDRAGEIIDIALQAGANSCDGISFQSTKAGEAYDEALTAALKEGARKAALVAAGLEVTLGDVVNVTESYGSYTGARYAKAVTEDAAMGASTQIVSDGLNFSATVQMVYEIR